MIDVSTASSLTAHERSTLANILNTVANGGAASVSTGPDASPRNHAFLDLVNELVNAGIMEQRQPGPDDHPGRTTGSLAAAVGARGDLRSLAVAARDGGFVAALADALSDDAVAARQRQQEIVAMAREGILHPSIPPPPGFDRQGRPHVGSETLPANPQIDFVPVSAPAEPFAASSAELPPGLSGADTITMTALRDALGDLPATRRLQAAQAFAAALPALSDLILQEFGAAPAEDDER